MYRNVLIAVDGSEASTAVLAEVPRLADPTGTVTVIEVIDDAGLVITRMGSTSPAFYASNPDVVDLILDGQREGASTNLEAARATLSGLGVSNVETRVCSGVPGDTIVEEAQRVHASVVVMGSHGRGGFKRAVLGSVADYVLRHLTGTPLLIVRPTPKD
ncbi:MAG: universal stress protein [Chloroflexi bacterium]|nr:universal stress protein [Chloroflexota bacterium]